MTRLFARPGDVVRTLVALLAGALFGALIGALFADRFVTMLGGTHAAPGGWETALRLAFVVFPALSVAVMFGWIASAVDTASWAVVPFRHVVTLTVTAGGGIGGLLTFRWLDAMAGTLPAAGAEVFSFACLVCGTLTGWFFGRKLALRTIY